MCCMFLMRKYVIPRTNWQYFILSKLVCFSTSGGTRMENNTEHCSMFRQSFKFKFENDWLTLKSS